MSKINISKENDYFPAIISESNISTIHWATHYSEVEAELLHLWNPDHPTTFFQGPINPAWKFGLAPSFRKSIQKIDRKLQGRILEAVMKICDEPTRIKGDTIKPLSGTLEGLWRYRIGDYRLVYQADISRNEVLLLEFSSRGSVYE